MEIQEGRRRVVIESVEPEIDGGRFPAKRIVGDEVIVEADIFADGHDVVDARLLYRPDGERKWTESPMEALVNDRWRGSFRVERLGRYFYTLAGWVDHFLSWHRDLKKRLDAGDEDIDAQMQIGAALVEAALARAPVSERRSLRDCARILRQAARFEERIECALNPALVDAMRRWPDRSLATRYGRELPLVVDREKARFSSWYEMFPRSASSEPERHGTFDDVIARLPYVASMGFDVLYLPPIHPIGSSFRKGPNNVLGASAGDAGSPWAIGSAEGGHDAIHPQLGTMSDFRRLIAAAKEQGIEIALDVAFQVSPDHPFVSAHPGWFRHRPDGSVQYAENPPKKYQDIYPFDFESGQWRELWNGLRDIFLFWAGEGIRIFRVDNPHTKPFAFWEWVIDEIRTRYPDTIFLSEAFTRPKVMYYLAKEGFTQSYTYFAWRTQKWELEKYFTELTTPPVRDFFRPNAWPNTPDILTEQLQFGGRPAFVGRLILAATLCASYGIYGPPFELQESVAREPGSEEYRDSEKYQIRQWNVEGESLRELIARVNRIRRENRALHSDVSLHFHPTTSDQLICYSKNDPAGENAVLVVVNLDPYHTQAGEVILDLEEIGVEDGETFQVHDLLTGSRYFWNGSRNYVELNPHVIPAHVFAVRKRIRREESFEYFL